MSVRMDSHTDSAQISRLEVVESGRRRRWSEDEKLRIVVESLNGPRLVSATARRYGISPGLLYTWRRAFRVKPIGVEDSAAGFVPAMVVAEAQPGTARGTNKESADRRIGAFPEQPKPTVPAQNL